MDMPPHMHSGRHTSQHKVELASKNSKDKKTKKKKKHVLTPTGKFQLRICVHGMVRTPPIIVHVAALAATE